MLHGLYGDIFAHAIGVAISPIPIVAVILILFTPLARTNSLAFVGGWFAGLTIVSAVVLFSGGFGSDQPAAAARPSLLSGLLRLGFGLLFLGMAVRRWIKRPRPGEDPKVPRWMGTIDRFGALKSLAMGAFLSGVNPKNLALTMGAASHVAVANLTTGEQILGIAIFIVLACTTVAAPVLVYQIVGQRAEARLQRMKDWLLGNNNTVMIVLLVIFGVKLTGNGLGSLLT